MHLMKPLIMGGLFVFLYTVANCQNNANSPAIPGNSFHTNSAAALQASYPWSPQAIIYRRYKPDGQIFAFHIVDLETYEKYKDSQPQKWFNDVKDCLPRKGNCIGTVVITPNPPE